MKLPRIALIALIPILCSCSSTPFIGKLSPQAAKRQAERDFMAGTPKIYKAGSEAAFEPGIEADEKALVAKLPRDGALTGCTNPQEKYPVGYATAYNKEIIFLMKERHRR